MIATTALLATVCPKVGPTEVESNDRTPNRVCSELRSCGTLAGEIFEEIWNTLGPRALLLIRWIVGSGTPSLLSTERIWDSLAALTRLVVMRVPDVKSIPRCRPRPPMASAPTSRITPDIEKKYFEAPMKSMRQACFSPAAPSAAGLEINREPPIVIKIAWVAMTAVN